MIKYALKCSNNHQFEAWFRNSAAFDAQLADGQLACPHCADSNVTKSLMAPNISSKSESGDERPSTNVTVPNVIQSMWREFARSIKKEADDVGSDFPDEARKIHFNEVPPRKIWGKATISEAEDLMDDGIAIIPLPDFPEDAN